MDADLNVETESTAAMLETPYTSENLQAGTWPKNTTKAALGEADITVEAEQQAAGYKVETAGTVPDRTTTAGITTRTATTSTTTAS